VRATAQPVQREDLPVLLVLVRAGRRGDGREPARLALAYPRQPQQSLFRQEVPQDQGQVRR